MELPPWRLSFFAVFTSFFACFVIGYNTSCMNIPKDAIEAVINESMHRHYSKYLATSPLDSLFSFLVTIHDVGAVVGAVTSMLIVNRLGRRYSHFIVCPTVSIVGSVLQSVGVAVSAFELMVIGRFLSGLSSGLVTGTLPIYLTECSPDRFRGIISNMENMFITSTTLVSTVFSLKQVLGVYSRLAYLLGIPIIPAVFLILMTPFFPETPKYLYVMKKNPVAAKKSLLFFHGPNANVEKAFLEYQQESEMAETSVSLWDVLSNHNLRFPAIMGALIMVASISTGILAIFNYSSAIFKDVTGSNDFAAYGTIIMSFCNLIGGVGSVFIIDRFGRRPMMLYGASAIVCCNICFVIFYEVSKQFPHIKALSYVACVLIVLHVTIYNLGPGSVGWFYAAEVTPSRGRSVISSLCVTINWITSIVINQVFLVLNNAINAYTFIVLFIAPSIVLIILLSRWLPETKNKSVEEISKAWWRGPLPSGKAGAELSEKEAELVKY